MRIDEVREPGVVVIAPAGRVDSTTSDALDRHLRRLLDMGERRLVIDFAAVEYISSAGLQVLLIAAKRLRDLQGSLVLSGMGDVVRQVFELAGFVLLFAIEPSREAAVRRVSVS